MYLQQDTGAPSAPQTVAPTPEQIRAKMKATWEDGDYATFATFMEPGAIEILENWRLPPGSRVLDIGCGAGQSAIPAARHGHEVTGIDIARNLIDHARSRAAREGLDARFEVGSAESLPCADDSFDAVISQIGAMFAPDPERVSAEIARVCRSGGRLHMANWTPEGFAATMFRCVARYSPPPAGIPAPALWGVEDVVEQRLGDAFTGLVLERRHYPQWRYPFGVPGVVEFFRRHFGPVKRAFEAQDEHGQAELRAELETIYASFNTATDGTTEIRGEYLDVSARRI